MKKVWVAAVLIAGALALTSCGGAEKCPAYTAVPEAGEVNV